MEIEYEQEQVIVAPKSKNSIGRSVFESTRNSLFQRREREREVRQLIQLKHLMVFCTFSAILLCQHQGILLLNLLGALFMSNYYLLLTHGKDSPTSTSIFKFFWPHLLEVSLRSGQKIKNF